MNNYAKYKNLRDASWQCLIDCDITALPVSVSDIAAQQGVSLYEYADNRELIHAEGMDSLLQADAFSYADAVGQMMIFFDGSKPRRRIRYTLAHELGHILLGHVGGHAVSRSTVLSPADGDREQAADMFAARLLEPACVLWGLGAHTPEEISAVCDVSLQAAGIRAQRMKVLLHRGAWLKSPLERRVYEQFSEYIASRAVK